MSSEASVENGARSGRMALREALGESLADLQRLVATLRKELADVRAENARLAKEHRSVRRLEQEAELARLKAEASETRRQQAHAARLDAEKRRARLQEENAALEARCLGAERAFQAQRDAARLARKEIAYLEEQIEHLRAALELAAVDVRS